MEIRFDPLNEREAEAVAKFLNRDLKPIVITTAMSAMSAESIQEFAKHKKNREADALAREHADASGHVLDSDRTTTAVGHDEAPSQSAVPLEDAPLAAAADLFPSVPAAQPVGQASETSVPTPPAVPAPPQVAAPSAPAAAMNPADVDKHGLPWDARIHSGTKAVNADGSWRQRRGLNDPELVKRVEAELRALMAVPVSAVPLPPVSGDTTMGTASSETIVAATSVPSPPPVVSATTQDGFTVTPISAPAAVAPPPVASSVPNVPPPPVVPVPLSSVPATAPIPSPPAVPAPPTVAVPAAPITFADVMRKVTSNIASGKITEAEVHAGLMSIGLQAGEIGKMNGRPELIKAMSDYLDQLLISKAGV